MLNMEVEWPRIHYLSVLYLNVNMSMIRQFPAVRMIIITELAAILCKYAVGRYQIGTYCVIVHRCSNRRVYQTVYA